MNTAQFQRIARLATIASQITSERGVAVLNLLLEQAALIGTVKAIMSAEMQTNDSRGKLVEGLVSLRIEVMTLRNDRLTLWLEVNPQDRVVFDIS